MEHFLPQELCLCLARATEHAYTHSRVRARALDISPLCRHSRQSRAIFCKAVSLISFAVLNFKSAKAETMNRLVWCAASASATGIGLVTLSWISGHICYDAYTQHSRRVSEVSTVHTRTFGVNFCSWLHEQGTSASRKSAIPVS